MFGSLSKKANEFYKQCKQGGYVKITNRDYEYRLNYRFPWEFIFCAWKFRKAVMLWVFYCWTDTMKNLWIDVGWRFLGIEFMKRKYGRTENVTQNIADEPEDK